MKIRVIGGGPGGLFFSLLAKRADPTLDIDVIEQNPEGATYGWGVVFSDRAVKALRSSAPDVVDEIAARRPPVEHMDIVVADERRSVHGHSFHRIGRARLLDLLAGAAVDAGVTITYGRRVETIDDLGDADLIVGADGVNSRVRELLADDLRPDIRYGRNWWAWYGTDKLFEAVSLLFEPTDHGLFVGHAYQYDEHRSGFVVEAVPSAFEAAQLEELTPEASRVLCAKVFERHLGGRELLDNRSLWFRPIFVTCSRWSVNNVTLLGDALHTVHPSIGSGTRFAMRDAVALSEAIAAEAGDPIAAVRAYEDIRRPAADGFQAAARRSIVWYEGLEARDLGDPTRFALEYVMRTGRVRYEDFRRRNGALVRDYERPSMSVPRRAGTSAAAR